MTEAEKRDAFLQAVRDSVPRAAFAGGLPDLAALPPGQFLERGRAIHAVTPMLREMWPIVEGFRMEHPESLGLRRSTATGVPELPPERVREALRLYTQPSASGRNPAFHALGTWIPSTLLAALRIVARRPQFAENCATLEAFERRIERGTSWESYFDHEVVPGVMAVIDIFSVCCELKRREPQRIIVVIRNSEDLVFWLGSLASDSWTKMSLVTGLCESLGTARFANPQLFKIVGNTSDESIFFRDDIARKIREEISGPSRIVLADAEPGTAVRFGCAIIYIDLGGISMFRAFYRWAVNLLADA